MTRNDLVQAYGLGVWAESEHLEWKASSSNSKEIVESVAAFANTDERLTASVQRGVLESKQVVLMVVQESPLKPHLGYGRAFRRMGSSNVAISQAEHRQMLAEKQNGAGAVKIEEGYC